MPLTEPVKRNRCLLLEVDRNANGVDGVRRGNVTRS